MKFPTLLRACAHAPNQPMGQQQQPAAHDDDFFRSLTLDASASPLACIGFSAMFVGNVVRHGAAML